MKDMAVHGQSPIPEPPKVIAVSFDLAKSLNLEWRHLVK
jgi:hypothetical protein